MKKYLIAALLLTGFVAKSMSAYLEVYSLDRASYTATAETTKVIPQTFPGTILDRVVIGSGTVNGVITLYDSSATAQNIIAVLNMNPTTSAPASIQFGVRISSGLTYTTSAAGAGVTIIYKTMRP